MEAVEPFDQPDVEASKIVTRRLAQEYEATGALPEDAPMFEADGLSLFGDARATQPLGRQEPME